MGCSIGKGLKAAKVTSVSPDRHVLLHNMESSDSSEEKANSLTIIHFNDVYNIEPREKDPVGGAARFATKVKELGWKNPLVLFSGDALSPSKSKTRVLQWSSSYVVVYYIVSSITRGEQMIPILNALNVNTAVFGNHDFGMLLCTCICVACLHFCYGTKLHTPIQ